ncbi:alpha/beta fold hydrolase [Vulcanisaeta sp. JCM 14467]
MPFAVSRDGTRIYYEVVGSGEPLVLIQGFSWDLTTWHFQWELAYRFRLVLIDNRGVGLSDKPTNSYSMDRIIDDVYSVVSALNLRSFHLLGFSMGGMITQGFVLKYGDLVKSLILVSTMPRPIISASIGTEFLSLLKNQYDDYGFFKSQIELAFSEQWVKRNPDAFENFVRLRYNLRMPLHAYLGQLSVILVTNYVDKLGSINVPTTIMHGNADRLVSIKGSEELFNGIRLSRYIIFNNTGHAIYIERPHDFNRRVEEHVRLVNENRFSREGPITI